MKKATLTILSFFFVYMCNAQIGIGTTSPHQDAILDVNHPSKGLLIPRVSLTNSTSALPMVSHVAGMMVYNTSTIEDVVPGFYFNNGTNWALAGSGGSGSVSDVISAEYEGAVFDSTGTNGANIGCLFTANTGATDNYRNAYTWETSELSNQTYNIIVRYPVPSDFDTTQTNWFDIDYTMTYADAELSITIVKDDNTQIVNKTTIPDHTSGWTTHSIGTAPLANIEANDVLIITLELTANNANNASVSLSDFVFKYDK